MNFFQGMYIAMASTLTCGGLAGLVLIRLPQLQTIAIRLHLGSLCFGAFLFGSAMLIAAAIAAFRISWLDRHQTPQS